VNKAIAPRSPRQFRRQQARAHRLPRRMPARQIARHRKRRNHAPNADPVAHDSSLIISERPAR